MNKKINIFGKKIPTILVVVSVLLIGTASAVLLTEYFTIEGTIEVKAPLFASPEIYSATLSAGEQAQDCADVTNSGDNSIMVELQTTILNSGDEDCSNHATISYDVDGFVLSDVDANGDFEVVLCPNDVTTICISAYIDPAAPADTYTITTTAVPPTNVDFVVLSSKNTDWEPTYEKVAVVIFEESSDTFNFAIYADGLADEEYSLIYYADYSNRFTDYDGSNPGGLITTVTPELYYGTDPGEVYLVGSVDIGMDLPCTPDANMDISEHDYRGAPDYYEDSTGAKLWLVPSSGYLEPGVIGWNHASYLFETGLINYEDTNAVV